MVCPSLTVAIACILSYDSLIALVYLDNAKVKKKLLRSKLTHKLNQTARGFQYSVNIVVFSTLVIIG
jgi:hypothetical protein